MNKIVVAFVALVATSTMSFAQTANILENPCERGPVPEWAMINGNTNEFVDFIQEVRPDIPRDVASYIAYQVCADMSIEGNSAELTNRLNLLLSKY